MEEEGTEREEREPEEPEAATAPPPKKSRTLLVVVAIVVVVAVIGGVLAYQMFRNSVPTASFTASSVDLHLSVNGQNSTDSDGDALVLTWNWGDSGAQGTGVVASHDYSAAGSYTITLTVSDGRGGSATATKVQTIIILPTPTFVARQQAMNTTFDATGSTGSAGHAITSYAWDFGDGANGTGLMATHTYSTPGRYSAKLTVTDSAGLSNSVAHYVSANTTTVDVLGTKFFSSSCPYQNYWYLRYNTYGDRIQNNGQFPCFDYYPWVLYTKPSERSSNPSWTYTLWRLDMLATNNLGYSVWNPVYLPVFNSSVAPASNSFIAMNLSFNYLNDDNNLTDHLNIKYWDTTPWKVNTKYSDGFGYLVQGNITMDLTESQRVFGVVGSTPSAAQSWWYRNTAFGGNATGVELKFGTWLDQQGNGPYDIFNGFQWYYESDIADLNATVASDGTTTVHVFLDGWGYDVLFARWSYWGVTNYSKAVTSPYGPYKPKGWMPFETCWCENATINATIREGLDMHYAATSEYWFGAVGNPGPDGILNTTDDLPGWAWSPSLMDYVPRVGSGLLGASSYPHSELAWYENSVSPIASPGSWGYGSQYEYMVVPDRWNMSLGNTVTLVMPNFKIPWVDPTKSTWNTITNVTNYVTYNSYLRLTTVEAGGTAATGFWTWDARSRVFSMAAPAGFQWPDSGVPLNPDPYIEFGPETTGG